MRIKPAAFSTVASEGEELGQANDGMSKDGDDPRMYYLRMSNRAGWVFTVAARSTGDLLMEEVSDPHFHKDSCINPCDSDVISSEGKNMVSTDIAGVSLPSASQEVRVHASIAEAGTPRFHNSFVGFESGHFAVDKGPASEGSHNPVMNEVPVVRDGGAPGFALQEHIKSPHYQNTILAVSLCIQRHIASGVNPELSIPFYAVFSEWGLSESDCQNVCADKEAQNPKRRQHPVPSLPGQVRWRCPLPHTCDGHGMQRACPGNRCAL